MPPILSRSLVVSLLCMALGATFGAQVANPDLTAHEWGTFTSVAGLDGRAADWLPLGGSATLPDFVEKAPMAGKGGLRGTIRMETPVLYFYSPSEMTVSVKVGFSKGVLTEWYPHASRVEPKFNTPLAGDAIYKLHKSGRIAWDSVTISPSVPPDFPIDKPSNAASASRSSQYYAARETAATPLRVNTAAGQQQEKFLFYRGVATFSVPVSATVSPEGSVHLANLSQEEVPAVLLLERRGDKLGYRLGGALQGELSLDPPELTSTVESLSRDLADILTGQGLNRDEALAMIATWRDSWFEEGSRLLYIVPDRFVNTVLPLRINPAPSQTVRVFVGRVELVTPATTQAVAGILAAHDHAGLIKYQRFLEPILATMKAQDPAHAADLDKNLDLTYETPIRTSSSK
jgi:hypothetical protein